MSLARRREMANLNILISKFYTKIYIGDNEIFFGVSILDGYTSYFILRGRKYA